MCCLTRSILLASPLLLLLISGVCARTFVTTTSRTPTLLSRRPLVVVALMFLRRWLVVWTIDVRLDWSRAANERGTALVQRHLQ